MHLCRVRQHPCHGMPLLIVLLRILLLLLMPTLAQATSLPLLASDTPLLPGPVMQVWADPEGLADIHSVRQLPESAWQPVARRGCQLWLQHTRLLAAFQPAQPGG